MRASRAITRLARAVIAAGAVCAIGCQAQEDGGYRGESLMRVAGVVTSTRVEPTPDAEVTVTWLSASADAWGVDHAPVTADFPARFQLDVVVPPTVEALGESGAAIGIILVVPRGTALLDLGEAVLGACTTHVLLYVLDDVPADGELAGVLGFAPRAGFHLAEVVPGATGGGDGDGDAADAADDLRPVPAGTTEPLTINLVDDPASIDLPDVF